MKIHRCLNLLPIGREQLSLKREKKESSFQFEETGYKFCHKSVIRFRDLINTSHVPNHTNYFFNTHIEKESKDNG